MSTAESAPKHFFKREDAIYIPSIVLSAFVYALNMNSFVASGNLFPGGYAGFSRLISAALERFASLNISFGVIYFALNILTTLLIWRRIGHKFVIYSVLWFTLTSVFTSAIQVPPITRDELLICVFGGLINGAAVGLALRSNASSGGTDFISIYMSMRYNKPMWNYIMAANAIVLILAGMLFGWERALYSIIFQFVSTQVVNTMHQRYKVTCIHCVTDKPDEVCQAVFHACRHGITKVPCEGGYTGKPHWMLFITINTYQLREVLEIIRGTDEHAFLSVNSVERVIGNYYQKPLE